jgi:hypothetical protein
VTQLSGGWRQLDLGGGGLQRANLELARRLKRRRTAYALLAVAPLGLHRRYLGDRRGAWLWPLGAAAGVGAAFLDIRIALGIAALFVAALAYEAWWIDRQVTAANKRIRREVYLAQAAAPPPGFSGRFPNEHAPRSRAPSIAEQERLLRDLTRSRRGGDPGDDGA